MLLSLVMFGSRARGDHRMRSDVDLLGITETWRKSAEPYRGAAMYLYDFDYLLNKSRTGDLFVCHIVKEGRLLHDTLGGFNKIVEEFKYKSEYKNEIKCGSAIIKFLIANNTDLDTKEIRKRLVWAMRTILIGRSAERKSAVFSSQALEEFSSLKSLSRIIDNRNTVEIGRLVELAIEVDGDFGFKTKAKFPLDFTKQLEMLRRSGPMGKSTIELVDPQRKPSVGDYI